MCAQTNDDFVKRAAVRGIKILTSESFTEDPRQQVRNLKVGGARKTTVCRKLYRERKCADTIGTVLVRWAGHFQC